MNEYTKLGALVGNAVTAAGWLADMENIISIVCCVLGLLITLTTCVVIPVWKKIRAAREDGVITPEEAEDIANTLKDGIDEVKKGKGGK